MTAPRVPPEGPAENLRNALALLGGLRSMHAINPVLAWEAVEAVSQRIWRALQQLESK